MNKQLKTNGVKICMIAMFKNEAHTIRQMLDSITPYISYWVIQNNGSSDGTDVIVKQWAQETGIPGELYDVEEGWIGFGWNRDHVLQRALKSNHECDWIMKMDCDEILQIDDSFDWSLFNTNHQSYHVTSLAPNLIYFRAWIWNAKLPWRFNHDPAHETIYLDDGTGDNFERINLPQSFRMLPGNKQGESYGLPTKYVTDSLKLEEKLIRDGTMLTDLYHFWYIGKSYEDCYRGNFFPLKEEHQKEYARRCIFYFNALVNHTHGGLVAKNIDEMAYYAICSIGTAYRYLKEYDKAIEHYLLAERFSPPRNDHILYLAEINWELRDYDKMLKYTSILTDKNRKNPFPEYFFLINPYMYMDAPDGGTYINHIHNIALENAGKIGKDSVLVVNKKLKKRIFVVDNFYSDPDYVRKIALEQDFIEDIRFYKGKRSAERFLNNDIKSAFENIIGQKINVWEEHGMNGKFQFCTPEDLLVYHHDLQNWAGVLYLTPNAPYNTGTCLYAHKETRIRHADEPGCDEICFKGGFYDETKFDLVDVVGNIYNRVVIFDSKSIHAAQKYFGQTKHNARLFHLFFFD
jgi:tetratricopeptide (TPR) repeat protein